MHIWISMNRLKTNSDHRWLAKGFTIKIKMFHNPNISNFTCIMCNNSPWGYDMISAQSFPVKDLICLTIWPLFASSKLLTALHIYTDVHKWWKTILLDNLNCWVWYIRHTVPNTGPVTAGDHKTCCNTIYHQRWNHCWWHIIWLLVSAVWFHFFSAFFFADSFVNSQEWTLSRSVPELKVVSIL